jgi:hypothetical protein
MGGIQSPKMVSSMAKIQWYVPHMLREQVMKPREIHNMIKLVYWTKR